MDHDTLNALAHDRGAAGFLLGWLRYLENRPRYLASHRNRYVAIDARGDVVASALSVPGVYQQVDDEAEERGFYITLVEDLPSSARDDHPNKR